MKYIITRIISAATIAMFAASVSFASYAYDPSQDGDNDGCINDNNWNGEQEICEDDSWGNLLAIAGVVIALGYVIHVTIGDGSNGMVYSAIDGIDSDEPGFESMQDGDRVGIQYRIPFDLK